MSIWNVFGISWNFQLSIFQVLGLWSGTKTGRDLRHTLEFLESDCCLSLHFAVASNSVRLGRTAKIARFGCLGCNAKKLSRLPRS